MKVVVRSSSLVFTMLSIILKMPITRVKAKAENAAKKPNLKILPVSSCGSSPERSMNVQVNHND